MKEEYILYLDESELSDSGIFAIAGFAIKKDNIKLLEEKIRDVKKLIWNESYILLIIQFFIVQNFEMYLKKEIYKLQGR